MHDPYYHGAFLYPELSKNGDLHGVSFVLANLIVPWKLQMPTKKPVVKRAVTIPTAEGIRKPHPTACPSF